MAKNYTSYPDCKKCGEMMDTEEKKVSQEPDGLRVIYVCEDCNLKLEAYYELEHLSPTNEFWSDEQ